jgi:hypothetical protein
MIDQPPLPDFGDVVGLRRLYRAAVERIRWADMPEADKWARIAELSRQYWAAREAASGFPAASRNA